MRCETPKTAAAGADYVELDIRRTADGTLVDRTNLPGQSNMKRVLKIEKFTPEAVVIHRIDTGSNPADGMMRGRMQYGNSSATDGHWIISWGESLAMLVFLLLLVEGLVWAYQKKVLVWT